MSGYKRGPLWAYMVVGAMALPFLAGFILGMLRIGPIPPNDLIAVFAGGAAIGWLAWRLFSRVSST